MKKISRGSKIFFALSIVTFLAGIGVVIYYFTRIKFQNSIKYIELAFSSMEDAEKYLRLTDKVQRIFIDIFVVAFVELLIGFIIIGLRVLIAKMKQNKEAKVQRRNAAPAPTNYGRGIPQGQIPTVNQQVMQQPIPQPIPQSVPQQQNIPVQPPVMQQPVQQPIPQQQNIPVQPPVIQQPIQQPIPQQQNIQVPPPVPQQQNIPTQPSVMQQPIQQAIPQSVPQHQNVMQDASTQRFCMTCGTRIVSGSKFCPKCGSKTI